MTLNLPAPGPSSAADWLRDLEQDFQICGLPRYLWIEAARAFLTDRVKEKLDGDAQKEEQPQTGWDQFKNLVIGTLFRSFFIA